MSYPMIGTFALDMIILEVDLMPISRIADAGGPTKMRPESWQSPANSTFSDRNPYPGWIACAPQCFATCNNKEDRVCTAYNIEKILTNI